MFKQLKLLEFSVKFRHWCGDLEVQLILLLKLAEYLLLADCWRANKIWSALIDAGVCSMQNCGWLVELVFFFFPEEISKGPKEDFFSNTCHHIKGLLWAYFLWGKTQEDSHFRMGIFLELSSFDPWYLHFKLPDVSGTAPVRPCRFWRISSSSDKTPKMRLSVLQNSRSIFFVSLPSISSGIWVI